MGKHTAAFEVAVRGVKGTSRAGEKYAKERLAAKAIPVLTCEGPCIRGEIARLAGNMITREVPELARACPAETFFVPHSAMATWVKQSTKVVMIDGCALKGYGRLLQQLVPGKVVHIDALPLHNRYNDVFLMDDVHSAERRTVAREVAEKIIGQLRDAGHITASWPECAAPNRF